jgi:uncharacterized protein
MKNTLTHFAIYIDNMQRAKSFYSEVFNWGFNAYGQSDFLQIKADISDNGALIGALQSRKYSPVSEKIIGLKCSIAVENIESTIEKVKLNKGQILMNKTLIPFVGRIAKFLDTEGNLICAVEYDNNAK